MAIDPQAKIIAQDLRRNKKRERAGLRAVARKKSRKRSALSQSEKITIANLAQDNPSELQIEATAIALRRQPETIRSHVALARATFESRAQEYVDLHMEASRLAIATGEVGEARKAAEWAMTNLSSKSGGKVERIVDRDTAESNSPVIQIGIALGGLPPATIERPTLPIIDVD